MAYPQEDDFICPVGSATSQQIPTFEESGGNTTGDMRKQSSADSGLKLAPNSSHDFHAFPREEQIVAAAGLKASLIDWENLP